MTDPDDDDAGDADARLRDRRRRRACGSSTPATCPAGSAPGRTRAVPAAGDTLIERFGYLIRSYRVTPDGHCPSCQTAIPGVWPAELRGEDGRPVALPRTVAAAGSYEDVLTDPCCRDLDAWLLAQLPPSTALLTRPQRPQLRPEQKQAILAATSELLCATILRRKPHFPDPTLAGAGDIPLSGAFVSLKRGKHLRACCGGLHGQPIALGRTVYDAALRSALEDVSLFRPCRRSSCRT